MLKKYPYRKRVTNSNSLSIAFDKDKLKEVSSTQTTVNRLEIIKNKKLGTASITGVDDQGLWRRAENSALFGDSVNYTYQFEHIYPDVALFDPHITKSSTKQLLTKYREIISELK